MVNKDTKNDNGSDIEIFRSAMKDVKPLNPRKERIDYTPPPPPPRARKQTAALPKESIDISFPFSDYEKLSPVSSEDLLSFNRTGISEKILRKLRRGQYNSNAVLDLHGSTTDEARMALDQFLTMCTEQKYSCVKIIHGRGTGTPVIKNRLNHWLREAPSVLAFCSINKGALYVLLKKTGNR